MFKLLFDRSMNNKISFLLQLLCVLGISIFFEIDLKSQEVLIQLEGNPLIKKHYLEQKRYKKSEKPDTLELPFFDDFSNSSVYPNPVFWADKDAFINGTYAIDPPSVGVATLDAVDYKGDFYASAGYGNYFTADYLTSNPINLNYPTDKNIYLSFFYQPQGRGDYPEIKDSLILEFYDPLDSVWNRVWFKEGGELTDFKDTIIQVWPEKYLKKGFQFRFRNIASLTSGNQPSKAVNADHWNIDYIYLNRGRTAGDTVYKDIAFVYPLESCLKYYESMPWKHFILNRKAELKSTVRSVYKNNYNTTRAVISRNFVFYDHKGNQTNDTVYGGAWNEPPGVQIVFDPVYSYSFLSEAVDSASFTIKALIKTDTDDPIQNNEILFTQKFYDYYAYDDGSAEAGYGLIGEGTQNALLAYKFDCKKQDTLKAIQIYFNKSLNDKSQKYFYLTIWDDNDGEPGQVIYQREGIRPEYEGDLNKFHTYEIDDTTIVLKGVFYVGWKQTTPDLLNIGFDFNNKFKDNSNKVINNIFYNINGTWEKSKFEGSLMIRTFFGKSLTAEVVPVNQKPIPKVNIYPNPANDNIKIIVNKLSEYNQLTVSIYNLTGSLVHQSIQDNNQSIDLSYFKEGTYIIRLTDKKKSLNYSCKFIKIK